ncbi:hypothetical protein XENOCAPTIV_011384, partial [Xenoophorus captivus]
AMSGGFNLQVNDGVNFTPRQIFSITAKALVVNLEKNRPLKVFPGKHGHCSNISANCFFLFPMYHDLFNAKKAFS